MKKVLISLAALIVGAVVTYEVIQIGGSKGDAAKGIVKSPPPDKDLDSIRNNCRNGNGVVTIKKSAHRPDEGKDMLFIDASGEPQLCRGDKVCITIEESNGKRYAIINSKCPF